jgi:integral membrane sensor domain MASE1
MRLRLVFLASLAGAVIGTAIPVLILKLVYGSMIRAAYLDRHVTIGRLIYLIPLVLSFLAAIFVHRHTARRRKLQSVLTAVLVLLFSWAALTATVLLV